MNDLSRKTSQFIEDDESSFDLQLLFNIIWARKWPIMGLSVAYSVFSAFMTASEPPVYEAEASLLIEQGEANVVSIQDVYNQGMRGWEYMQTQFELLRSRSLAERVVRRLQLNTLAKFEPRPPEKHWYDFDLSALKPAGFNSQPDQPWVMPSEEAQIQGLTDMVAGTVTVEQRGDSNVVSVIYRSDDPQLSATIVNTYLDEFIKSHLDANVESTVQATEWLNERLIDLRDTLKTSEDRLQSFRDEEQLIDLQGITTLSAQEISTLNNRYNESRQKRQELEATVQELREMKDASTEELLSIPDVLNHDLIRTLNQRRLDAERVVNELAQRYGPKHPKMIEAVTQLSSVRMSLDSEVDNVVYGIEREYQVALNTETSSKRQLDETKLDLQDLNRKEFVLKELEREVETNSQLYDVFLTRLKETGEVGIFEAPPARIIDLAQGGYQVGPNIRRSAMRGFIMAFALSCGLAMLLYILDNTVKDPSEVEAKLRVPMLGTLPLLKKSKEGRIEEYWDNPQSEFAEAIRTIRTGVVLSSLDTPSKIIVVTSSLPGEGKSTAALNLAASFAQMESTLVIGADLRRPSLARRCNLHARHPGLSNFVSGKNTLEECITDFGEEGLKVMPAGAIPSNPLELLSSNKFRDALELLKTRFDRIIIDSAPVGVVSDAMMLASFADSLIFLVKSDSTAATLARKYINLLIQANDPVTGVVLNYFDPAKSSKYYGTYGNAYTEKYYNTTDTHG
jgi:succinoglycan biosynthesis transport protein ExoP